MKVTTLTPVELDGKKIKVGTEIDVSDETGQQLLESNSAEEPTSAEDSDVKETGGKSKGGK